MKEERMFILKMVQDGKITADEAVKLLESISPSHSKSDTIRQVKEKANDIIEDAKPVVKKYANKATRVLNDVVDAFKEGVDNFNNKPKKSDFTDDLDDDFVVYDGSDDEQDMIDEIKKNADEKSHKISESVKENTSAVKETMKEAAKNIKENAKDMKDTVNIVAMDIKEKAENVKEDIEDAMKK